MTKNSLFLNLALAVLIGGANQLAAQEGPFSINTSKGVIEVTAQSALTVDFDVPFAEISIADPDTADISTLSANTVYLVGKKVGATTLTTLSGADPTEINHYKVIVYRDIAPLTDFLSDAAGQVSLVRDGVVVKAAGCTGTVVSSNAVSQVLEVAQDWGYVTLSSVAPC